ncbi:MAG: hypothetical protein LIO46_04400 [Clostridiales bacterium]|nr:hypothetical protein [Clostridiales bacterium]
MGKKQLTKTAQQYLYEKYRRLFRAVSIRDAVWSSGITELEMQETDGALRCQVRIWKRPYRIADNYLSYAYRNEVNRYLTELLEGVFHGAFLAEADTGAVFLDERLPYPAATATYLKACHLVELRILAEENGCENSELARLCTRLYSAGIRGAWHVHYVQNGLPEHFDGGCGGFLTAHPERLIKTAVAVMRLGSGDCPEVRWTDAGQ